MLKYCHLQSSSLLLKHKGDDTYCACGAAGPAAVFFYPERTESRFGDRLLHHKAAISIYPRPGLRGEHVGQPFLWGVVGKITSLLRVIGLVL